MSDEANRANDPAPVDRISQVWRRLNEHKIVQWTIAYIALAYGIQHALTLTGEAFEWPRAVLRLSMLLLALGLPLVVTFAWYHGARASRNFSQAELSILAALMVVGSLVFYVFVRPDVQPNAPVAQEASVTAARAAAASPKGAISVVVLPFSNMSGDASQEFFSDGMTEEITAALAKVPDLRVVARTSAFEFKGKNIEIEKIGQQLHATHLIEGSVRKAGNRVRITAQLIKADDGTHIWAENYDRELTDVFAIQEDIARAITTSLHMTLGLKPGENLVNNRSIDTDSYEKYLRARALTVARGAVTVDQEFRDMTEAATLLEAVLARNPGYAPAWYRLGIAHGTIANRHVLDKDIAQARSLANEFRARAEADVQKALQLDPNMPEGYALLAWFARAGGHPLESDQFLTRSLALDPLNPDVLFVNGMLTASAGRLKDGLAFSEKGHAVDPFYPNLASQTARARWLNSQNEEAIALARTLRLTQRAPLLAEIYASMGRYGEAADALMELAAGDPNSNAAKAARLLRTPPAKPASPAEQARLPTGLTPMLYLYLGAPERTLEAYERAAEIHISGDRGFVWHPAFAPVRKTERFKALMRKVGLVEYWRAKGWPPQCHPTTGDDFECD